MAKQVSREERVNRILGEYLKAVDAGQPVNREQLLVRHPDLAQELGAFLRDEEQMARLAGELPVAEVGGAAPLPGTDPLSMQAPEAATLSPGAIPSAESETLDGKSTSSLQSPLADSEPSVPSAPTLPHIPGYEILTELGRGGMGVVFQARQLQLNRLVALKMILTGGFASATDLA